MSGELYVAMPAFGGGVRRRASSVLYCVQISCLSVAYFGCGGPGARHPSGILTDCLGAMAGADDFGALGAKVSQEQRKREVFEEGPPLPDDDM